MYAHHLSAWALASGRHVALRTPGGIQLGLRLLRAASHPRAEFAQAREAPRGTDAREQRSGGAGAVFGPSGTCMEPAHRLPRLHAPRAPLSTCARGALECLDSQCAMTEVAAQLIDAPMPTL